MCMNGGKCEDGRCNCTSGFTGEFCTQREYFFCIPNAVSWIDRIFVAICVEQCKNGGRCIGPDRCACIYGFAGKHCEIGKTNKWRRYSLEDFTHFTSDFRTGPCYTGARGSLCVNQLQGVVCTKTLCCATVGKAWGHPCEHCPFRLECDIGFIKNQKTAECIGESRMSKIVEKFAPRSSILLFYDFLCSNFNCFDIFLDINECEAIPHLCEGGQCVNSIGSFTCECPEGQARNLETNQCDDKDECEDEGVCENGRCVNTDGSYFCLCNPGFIQSQNQKYCIGEDFLLRSYNKTWKTFILLQMDDKGCVILKERSKVTAKPICQCGCLKRIAVVEWIWDRDGVTNVLDVLFLVKVLYAVFFHNELWFSCVLQIVKEVIPKNLFSMNCFPKMFRKC